MDFELIRLALAIIGIKTDPNWDDLDQSGKHRSLKAGISKLRAERGGGGSIRDGIPQFPSQLGQEFNNAYKQATQNKANLDDPTMPFSEVVARITQPEAYPSAEYSDQSQEPGTIDMTPQEPKQNLSPDDVSQGQAMSPPLTEEPVQTFTPMTGEPETTEVKPEIVVPEDSSKREPNPMKKSEEKEVTGPGPDSSEKEEKN